MSKGANIEASINFSRVNSQGNNNEKVEIDLTLTDFPSIDHHIRNNYEKNVAVVLGNNKSLTSQEYTDKLKKDFNLTGEILKLDKIEISGKFYQRYIFTGKIDYTQFKLKFENRSRSQTPEQLAKNKAKAKTQASKLLNEDELLEVLASKQGISVEQLKANLSTK